jgi:cyclophilin family peptidyl-prolyl cis-trans isomerase
VARTTDGPNRILLGIILGLPFLVTGAYLAWNEVSAPSCARYEPSLVGRKTFEAPPCMMTDDDHIYYADFDTDAGHIRFALDPILAPRSANNIVFLARVGFYDGQRVSRIEATPDHAFVQFGDPTGTGRGNAGYTYEAELPSPITRYTRGSVAMVYAGDDPTTAGSQFFIVVRDYAALSYPARQPVNTLLGVVLDEKSIATLDAIAAVPTMDGTPATPILIRHVTITAQERFTAGEPATPTPLDPSPAATAS